VPSRPARRHDRRPNLLAAPWRPRAAHRGAKFNGEDSWTWSFRTSAWAVSEDCGPSPGPAGPGQGRMETSGGARTGATVRPSPSCATPSSQTTSSGFIRELGRRRGWSQAQAGQPRSSQPLGHSGERHGTGSAFYGAAATRDRIIIDGRSRTLHMDSGRLLAVLGTGG